MTDRDTEAALVAMLSHLSAAEDAETADRAIDLYLGRFGSDHAARLAAVRRLTNALAASLENDETEGAEALATALKRGPR